MVKLFEKLTPSGHVVSRIVFTPDSEQATHMPWPRISATARLFQMGQTRPLFLYFVILLQLTVNNVLLKNDKLLDLILAPLMLEAVIGKLYLVLTVEETKM